MRTPQDLAATAMLDSFVVNHAPQPLLVPIPADATEPTTCVEVVFENPDGGMFTAAVQELGPTPQPLAAPAAAAPPPAAGDAAAAAAAAAASRAGSQGGEAAGGSGLRTVAVPYLVSRYDSFASICLRHSMSAEELQVWAARHPWVQHTLIAHPPTLCPLPQNLNGLRQRHVRCGSVILVWAERSEEQDEQACPPRAAPGASCPTPCMPFRLAHAASCDTATGSCIVVSRPAS